MEQLFTALTHAVEATPAIALGASLLWGILSVLLSPCHLSSIPLIVGFLGSQKDLTTRRAFTLSTAFAGGMLVTIAVIGALTAALGRMLGDLGGAVNYAVAALFFLVGLSLLDVLPFSLPAANPSGMRRRGVSAALLLGLVFGIALGPCTFAYMAPMLAIVFKAAAAQPLYSVAILLAYGLGHCGVIVGAGTAAGAVQRYLSWNAQAHGADRLRKACGVLVLLGGLYLLYNAR